MGIFDFLKPTKDITTGTGINERYYDDGQGEIWKRWEEKNGNLHGFYEVWYRNGKLKLKGEYRNNKLYGNTKMYHENGQLKSEGPITGDTREGKYKEYDKTGKLVRECDWENDVISKTIVYWENNQVLLEIIIDIETKKTVSTKCWDRNGERISSDNPEVVNYLNQFTGNE